MTARGYANFSVNYDPDGFGGLVRDDFLEALSAEGAPVSVGYRLPLPEQPAFARECVRSLVPDDVDLLLYRHQTFPGTEETIARRVRFSQRYLLADCEDIEAIPRAIQKIRNNAKELESAD